MKKTVMIVSLSAGTLGEDFVRHELTLGLARLEAMELNVKFSAHALRGRDYLARNPQARAADLLEAFQDPETDLILSANYGFIPRTYGDDGDPLDVLVLCSEELDPLTLVRCYPIGYISMLDGGKNDEKIIAIPFADPTYNTFCDLMELPGHIFDEMAHFFTVYKALEGKQAVAGDVNDRKAAVSVIQKAMDHYAECFLGGVGR